MRTLTMLMALLCTSVGLANGEAGSIESSIILAPNTDRITVQMVDSAQAATAATTGVGVRMRPGTVAAYKLGHEDIYTYVCMQIDMPAALLDVDGGTIRLVLQHELDPNDQVRVIDEHIALEWTDDSFGKRGRYQGRYGWTRQSAGGEHSWILGDQVPHTVAHPWDWIWIDDFARFSNNQVLGGNKIQICVHPHVTARIFFYD